MNEKYMQWLFLRFLTGKTNGLCKERKYAGDFIRAESLIPRRK